MNFQQCGLGSELLKCVFTYAEEKGIERTVGTVKTLDYPKNPNLLKWYANMGFTVTMAVKPLAVVRKFQRRCN
jgi:GNAT superfamily N-acetyltransferase